MRIALCAIACVLNSSFCAATATRGLYFGIFGGYTYLPSNTNNYTLDRLRNGDIYRGGNNTGLRAGYNSYPIDYELEYTYLKAKILSFNINEIQQTQVTGQAASNVLIVNIHYNLLEILSSRLFIGAGLGYINLHTGLNSEGPKEFTHFTLSENKFAYQGTAGLSLNFIENLALSTRYRYLATSESGNYGKAFQAHLAEVGLNYKCNCV